MRLTKSLLKIRYLYLLELLTQGYNYIMQVSDNYDGEDHVVYEKSFVNHPEFTQDYEIPYDEIGKHYFTELYNHVASMILPPCIEEQDTEWSIEDLIEKTIVEMKKFDKKEEVL